VDQAVLLQRPQVVVDLLARRTDRRRDRRGRPRLGEGRQDAGAERVEHRHGRCGFVDHLEVEHTDSLN
jgi:hypothetical protein